MATEAMPFFSKLYKLYLSNYLPNFQTSYNPARQNFFACFCSNTSYFSGTFFPYCVIEWNKLVSDIRNSQSVLAFKASLLRFIRPKCRPIYNIHDSTGLKYLTRLRLNLSHLREHKFHHNFQDTLNTLCSCSLEVESSKHFLLRCHFYACLRKTLLDKLVALIGPIESFSDNQLTNILLYGDENFDHAINKTILSNTISFLKKTERFSASLIA